MKTSFPSLPLARAGAIALLTTTAATAHAATGDVTRGAVSVTTDMGRDTSSGSRVGSVDAVIDQSGLSSTYVNGTTAFDSFAAGTNHANANFNANVWRSTEGVVTGALSFDLGGSYYIDGMAWFGFAAGGYRVDRLKVYADSDNDATNGNTGLLFDSGGFGPAAGSSTNFSKPNVFSFSSGATTPYVHIEILGGTVSSTSRVGLGEVVFRQSAGIPVVTAVPEPGTYALMGLGLLAIGYSQRRRVAPR